MKSRRCYIFHFQGIVDAEEDNHNGERSGAAAKEAVPSDIVSNLSYYIKPNYTIGKALVILRLFR